MSIFSTGLRLSSTILIVALSFATPSTTEANPGSRRVKAKTGHSKASAKGRAQNRSRSVKRPWHDHQKNTIIRVRRSKTHKTTVTTSDGPVGNDGMFTRHVNVEHKPYKSDSKDVFRPQWKASQVKHLVSLKQQGVVYDARSAQTKVRLFAPNHKKVFLVVEGGIRIRMKPDLSGTWEAVVTDSKGKKLRLSRLDGKEYYFEIHDGKTVKSISDPYGHGAGSSLERSRFANLDSMKWTDQALTRKGMNTKSTVIYETHVKDLSGHPSSGVPVEDRGKYAGAANSRVIKHIKGLGDNVAIELLPVHDFGPEKRARQSKQEKHKEFEHEGGHWGYMTKRFGAPAARYAKEAERAPREFQEMINKYRSAGIPVILDVVYNHTSNCLEMPFKALGETYYYRMTPEGHHHNGAGVGNEFKTESPMARKLVIQTLKRFAKKYHVDGFRFDLGAMIDVKTMLAIDKQLPKSVKVLTAEPWVAAGQAKWGKEALTGVLKNTRWSVWNDEYREAAKAMATGQMTEALRNKFISGMTGSVYPHGFGATPKQSVPYIASHDEYTVAHLVGGDVRRQLMSMAMLMAAQGNPMMANGMEMMRRKTDKLGNAWGNSYSQDNSINHLDYNLKKQFPVVYEATAFLIGMRARYEHFQHAEKLQSSHITVPPQLSDPHHSHWVLNPPKPVINGVKQPRIQVMYNAGRTHAATFDVPAGKWKVVFDGDALKFHKDGVRDASGTLRVVDHESYTVQPGTAVFLVEM